MAAVKYGAGAGQIEIVERIAVRGHGSRVGNAVGVLPPRRLGAQEGPERLPVSLRWQFPIGSNGVPAVAQPLLIGVTVLRDDRSDALRVALREPEADRRAVVEHIDREAIESDDLGEAVDDNGDVVESVSEIISRWHGRLAETRQIGRDDVETIGQEGDEAPEHVARAGKAVKQHQIGRLGCSSRAIEDLQAVYVDGSIFDGSHHVSPSPAARECAGRSPTSIASTARDVVIAFALLRCTSKTCVLSYIESVLL